MTTEDEPKVLLVLLALAVALWLVAWLVDDPAGGSGAPDAPPGEDRASASPVQP